jgi:hypothetical protein
MAGDKQPTRIELAPGDGAIVTRENGEPELFLPRRDDEENLSFPHTLLAGFALGIGLHDERLRELLGTILREKDQQVKGGGAV